ncbi:hypothetical protein [Nonomuraea zeae]|uniref:hypothetical protein n=1 Tax=Nonomuraea zeae TaxID=1642303 RepID=UPI0019814F35|nr:hypothetical protein [Nonomuraea zeae]
MTSDTRVALVTGVSRRAGIGFAVARELLATGTKVVAQSWTPHDAEHPWGSDPAGMDGVLSALGASATTCGTWRPTSPARPPLRG